MHNLEGGGEKVGWGEGRRGGNGRERRERDGV